MARDDVALTSSAEKELKRLPGQWIARIVPRLENLASNPRPSGCKKLRGGNDEWRLRVGDYRVVYVAITSPMTKSASVSSGFYNPDAGQSSFVDLASVTDARHLHQQFRVVDGVPRPR